MSWSGNNVQAREIATSLSDTLYQTHVSIRHTPDICQTLFTEKSPIFAGRLVRTRSDPLYQCLRVGATTRVWGGYEK